MKKGVFFNKVHFPLWPFFNYYRVEAVVVVVIGALSITQVGWRLRGLDMFLRRAEQAERHLFYRDLYIFLFQINNLMERHQSKRTEVWGGREISAAENWDWVDEESRAGWEEVVRNSTFPLLAQLWSAGEKPLLDSAMVCCRHQRRMSSITRRRMTRVPPASGAVRREGCDAAPSPPLPHGVSPGHHFRSTGDRFANVSIFSARWALSPWGRRFPYSPIDLTDNRP